MKRPVTLGLLSLCFATLSAQQYFQQEVNYKINVKLDDVKHELNADENLEYINNSPDQLSFIYFHVWPNAYKDNNTALGKQLLSLGNTAFYYASEEDRGYIDHMEFKVNGQAVKWNLDSTYNDIVKIYLNEPLKPGGHINITTPFHVKIPKGIYSRLGHLDQAYQITQWYPKPAVYDKNGWNPMPYLNQGEFYSEFGTYDVSITVPKNYVIGATGDLVQGEGELQWLNEKVKETEALKEFPYTMDFPASDKETKTLHYHQSKVHDFAWFADKRFHVLKGEVTLPQSGRKVTTWVMFTNAEAKLWLKGIEYINDGLLYYSRWNGDYPYDQYTAIDGALTAGAGMEYPNITVIGTSNSAYNHEVTIVHEVGHSWFYGVLGSNERKHPWMDEGINTFYETRYMLTKYPEKKGESEMGNVSKFGKKFNLEKLNHKKFKELAYLFNASRYLDQPTDLPAPVYTDFNYGAIIYDKSALILDYLKGYLGEELFDRCMHVYYETWKFKHPQPEDLQAVFEKETGKKLDWFFKDLIKTDAKLDYSLRKVKGDSVLVKNKTGLASPFSIGAYKDGRLTNIKWYDGFSGKQYVKYPVDGRERLKLDPQEEMPEINRLNNNLKTHGLFPRLEPIKFQAIAGIQNPDKSELYYIPVSGFNEYDKYMEGIVFYNSLVPFKKLEYELMPMYAFRNGHLNGGGNILYNLYPENTRAQNIKLGVKFERFSYNSDPYLSYYKLAPEVLINLHENNTTGTIGEQIKLRFIRISQQVRVSDLAPRTFEDHMYDEISYSYKDSRKINPYSLRISSEGEAQKYMKGMIEAHYKISYHKAKGVDIRWFGGAFLYTADVTHPFMLSGFNGLADYRFDEVFIGRSQQSGLLSRQFSEYEGAFKSFSYYSANRWMTAFNLKAAFPGRLPLGAYADFGVLNNLTSISTSDGVVTLVSDVRKTEVFYDAGAYVSLGGVLEVFFPLAYSKQIADNYDALNMTSYKEKIRFTLNLTRLNPFEGLRNISN